MEGVVVSAKRPGSTIMVSVSTNAQGLYSFPQDRLAPGAYDITMRAIGYTLKPTTATIQSGGSTQLDLELGKASRPMLASAPKDSFTRPFPSRVAVVIEPSRNGAVVDPVFLRRP